MPTKWNVILSYNSEGYIWIWKKCSISDGLYITTFQVKKHRKEIKMFIVIVLRYFLYFLKFIILLLKFKCVTKNFKLRKYNFDTCTLTQKAQLQVLRLESRSCSSSPGIPNFLFSFRQSSQLDRFSLPSSLDFCKLQLKKYIIRG